MNEHAQSKKVPRPILPVYLSFPRNVILGLCGGAALGGLLTLASVGLYTGGMRRVMLAYLVAFAFVLSLSLGSLFFVLIQHLTRAAWGVLVRRPAEIFSLNTISVAVLFLPIAWSVLGGSGRLYPWAQPTDNALARADSQLPLATVDAASRSIAERSATITVGGSRSIAERSATIRLVNQSTEHADAETHDAHSAETEQSAHSGDTEHSATAAHDTHASSADMYVHQQLDSLTLSKRDWLNPTAFLLRIIFFFTVWIAIASFYFLRSRRCDLLRGESDARRMEWWAGLSVFAFGITLTYAAFDLLMSLDPHWYSTIFGVYFFAGCAVGGFSINLLCVILLGRLKLIPPILSDEHRRDLGRLLFAFVFFWGYIAFSQYMLLWYANVPETTRWFVVRGASMAEGYSNSWGYLLVFLLLGHFIIPFLGIMSRHVKSHPTAMIFWTIWLLVMHYFDLVWLVMPEWGAQLSIGLPELGTLLFVGCVYLLGASLIATRTSLIPTGDPRLSASVAVTEAY